MEALEQAKMEDVDEGETRLEKPDRIVLEVS